MARFPKDNQEELIRTFGDPALREPESHLVQVEPPFKFTFGGKPFPRFAVHEKVKEPFKRALDKIWDYYGRDQATVDRLKISRTAGTYNPRKISGSSKWSNHAYGIAVDINSEENGFNTGHGTMPKPVVAAFKSEGFAWGGDYKSRTDPMHFEAVDRGQGERSFEHWLAYYNEPPSYPGVVPVPRPPEVPVPPPPPSVPRPPKPPRMLQRRSSGLDVRVIQYLLGARVDGYFGSETKTSVLQFQKAHGLQEDGIIGPLTWAALRKEIEE